MSNKYVVIDLETTGNSPKKGDKIIQFAAVVIENGQIIDQFSSLLCPNQSIPIFIEELTGITDQMVQDAPLFAEIAPRVMELLKGAYFVAHNVLFDLSFLQEELIMAGFEGFYGPILDTVELSRILFPSSDSFKLNDLAIQEGLQHDRPHQADSDAYVTGELLLILFDRLRNLPLLTIRQLNKLSGGLKGDLNELLEDLILIKESTVEQVPQQLEQYGGLFLKKLPIECETMESQTIDYPTNDKDKEQLLKNVFPNFEKRSGQFRMMDIVYDAFQKEHHAIIEAGTGVGKSLAYLLPAVTTALTKNKPIIISTYTTQLQEQLLHNDIPLLKKVVQIPFKTVMMKGKNHYIHLEKFVRSLRENDDNYDTTLTKMQILVWLTETITGDRDELNLSSGGQLFWHKIKHNENVFPKENFWRTRDFYLKTKKDALKADLIITNHSFLLIDLVSEQSILPPSEMMIIDEVHHFEKVAGKHFGSKFDYAQTRFLLQQIGVREQKQLAYKIEKMLEKTSSMVEGKNLSIELNRRMSELLFEMDDLFKIIALFAEKNTKNKNHSRISCSLNSYKKNESTLLKAGLERFLFLLSDYIKTFSSCYELLEKNFDLKSEKQEIVLSEMGSWLNDAEKMVTYLRQMILQSKKDNIYWIETDTRAKQNKTTIYSQPIAVSEQLKELFFEKKKSVVMTSATLTVKGSFQYAMSELGLEGMSCHQEQIPSPFHYDKQVQLIIPDDLPEINEVSLQEYVYAIGEHIISIAEATKGRMLILFTSYDMLRKTYELIKESGLLQDYSLLAQGITSGSRLRLTKNFQRFEKAILFGTSSFWEGIDIPGEDLSCLVIVRLPFSPPEEPIAEAKSIVIKQYGGNPFMEYSLPEAVLRFKQGFGRLIRTRSDKGIMIVFDRRIVTKRYGKVFLDAIPDVQAKEMNIQQIVAQIDSWL
jgi:ATP-dependent DNA helicase DinG